MERRRVPKEQRSTVEERRSAVAGACRTCLSTDRRTFAVAAVSYAYDLLTDWAPRAPDTRVCWECRAMLERVGRFKKRALAARGALEEALRLALQDQAGVVLPKTLSSLETRTRNGYNRTYVHTHEMKPISTVATQDCCTQVDLPETEGNIKTVELFSPEIFGPNEPLCPERVLIVEEAAASDDDERGSTYELREEMSDRKVFIIGDTEYDPSVPIDCDDDDTDQAEDTLDDNPTTVMELSDGEVSEAAAVNIITVKEVPYEVIVEPPTIKIIEETVRKKLKSNNSRSTRKRNTPASSKRIKVGNNYSVRLEELVSLKKVERFTATLQEVLALRRKKLRILQHRQFRCLLCVDGFRTQQEMEYHEQAHHAESAGSSICDICSCRFECEADRADHHADHFRLLRCARAGCAYSTRTARNIIPHIERHDRRGPDPPKLKKMETTCDICGGVFKTRQYYLMHRQVHISTQRFECDYCGRDYKTRAQVHKHLLSHERSFMCETCGKRCSSNSGLKQHKLSHLSVAQREYECVECHRKYATKYKLLAHIAWHRGERFQCAFCEKKFYSMYCLNYHVRKVHPDKVEERSRRLKEVEPRTKAGHRNEKVKKLECQICGKKFKTELALKTHFLAHTESEPYKCDECGKGFKMKASLNNHVISHKGEKPYKCSKCEKTFVTHTGMKWHESTHGDRKYECTVCGVKVHYPSNLIRHMKKHKVSAAAESPSTTDDTTEGAPRLG